MKNMQRIIEIVKRLFQFTSELMGAEDLNLGCILDSSGESFLAVSIHTYLYHRTIRSSGIGSNAQLLFKSYL